jgi:hypothetical protein
MTIWRALLPAARQQQNQQKVNKMLTISDTSKEKQPQQHEKWNIDPDEYDISRLQEYDKDLLIRIVESQHKKNQELRGEIQLTQNSIKKRSIDDE